MKKAYDKVKNQVKTSSDKDIKIEATANLSNLSANKTGLTNLNTTGPKHNASSSGSFLKSNFTKTKEVVVAKKKTEVEEEPEMNNDEKKKEYYNKLSLERINFLLKEYHEYVDPVLQPSVFFFKFLAFKQEKETEFEICFILTSEQKAETP